MKTEACTCGGFVVVVDGETVETAVSAHNETGPHRDWRRRREGRDTDRIAEEWRHRLARLDGYERDPMTPELLRELTAGRR